MFSYKIVNGPVSPLLHRGLSLNECCFLEVFMVNMYLEIMMPVEIVCLHCKSLNAVNAQIVSHVLLHVALKQNKEAFDGF